MLLYKHVSSISNEVTAWKRPLYYYESGGARLSNNTIMDHEVKKELDRYVSFISKMDGVLNIYLFGSYASGQPSTESDIDLMVVVSDGIDTLKVMQNVSLGLMNRRISLDVLVDSLSDFTELSKPDRVTLQREIKNRGVLVYGE